MGLLDELEQEAQRRKATLDDAERIKADRETEYRTRLDPAMQALYEFLARLIDNLKFLKPRRAQVYALPGYGDVVAYPDHEYELRIAVQPLAKDITLTFGCVVAPEESPAVEVQGAGKIKAMNATFQKHRLAGVGDIKKDDAGEATQATFRARGKIPLVAQISADADSGAVKMLFTNFDSLGTVNKTVVPAQFNDQLFDDLARFIAREPSNLFREALPDDFRKQLQQKVQQEQLRRKWETKIAQQQREELDRLKNDQGGAKARPERTPDAPGDKSPGLFDKVRGIFRKT